ncbi:HEPN domain-containing protein [Thermococcus sp. SY098]|uniref:HEPN domain-containing protein n=1 Tax=Thermococcus sp. SY098 TaxID=3111325 RepID=UPI002D78FF6B|nr:HEPN domain-containing protein [Thermococcus sp. SY098]WRS53183.1 HEPN domain-containing protein [Thermococcus sp. SY098]
MFDREEFIRWFKHAEYTLKSAIRDKDSGDYSWACFKAQQAAELAVKALLYGLGIMTYGHSIKKLLDILSKEVQVPQNLFRNARVLDRHYIPPRYPDAYIEGSPYEYYDKIDAEEAIRAAGEILNFVREIANASIQKRD